MILVYDVGEKRVGKMLKLCRRYLSWVQNSVFEGYMSDSSFRELKMEIKNTIKEDDSVIIFSGRIGNSLNKQIIGKERMSTDNFL